MANPGEPAPAADQKIYIEYWEQDDPHLQRLVDWINESDMFDWFAQEINDTYLLPRPIRVIVGDTPDATGFTGPRWRPENGSVTIVMPPASLNSYLVLFRKWWSEPEERALSAFTWAFLHEIGHALMRVLKLPVLGPEEDAADAFATFISIKYADRGHHWIAYNGALLFRFLGWERGTPSTKDYWKTHSLHEQRDTNILCWLYGDDPITFGWLADTFPESKWRFKRCGWEWGLIESSWSWLLYPHVEKQK